MWIFTQKGKFSNKNYLFWAWREFHSTSCLLYTYPKGPARTEKSSIFNFEHVKEVWISVLLGVNGHFWLVANVALRFGFVKQSKNLERCLLCMYCIYGIHWIFQNHWIAGVWAMWGQNLHLRYATLPCHRLAIRCPFGVMFCQGWGRLANIRNWT